MKHFRGPRGGRDPFGSAKNAETHSINLAMSTDPQTLEEISARTGIANRERIRQHMRWLVEHGFASRTSTGWMLTEDAFARLHSDKQEADFSLPDEVDESTHLIEGATRRITVNAYERNPEARRECIRRHGTTCCICGFDFGKTYGKSAEGYIHVHHLRPLSEIGVKYVVDPVQDLRPVCPNCHAVIHLDGECRTIEEVKHLLRRGD